MMIELEQKHLWNVSDMRGNCLWIVYLLGLFDRVLILWCEYSTRLFPFCVYKGKEKKGIRKMIT
jgi:hypothetical protein